MFDILLRSSPVVFQEFLHFCMACESIMLPSDLQMKKLKAN